MVIAQEIATGLDDPNVTGPQFLAFMKSCVTTDDISFMAEALLASAAAAQAMREVLEKTPCFGCGVRFGDNRNSALSCVRGCVNCKDQREALAAVEKATKP